eukprot:IDg23068t1
MISTATTPPSERRSCFRPKHALFGILTLILLFLRVLTEHMTLTNSFGERAWIGLLVQFGNKLFVVTLFAALVRWMWRFAVHKGSRPDVVAELASAAFVVFCYTSGNLLQWVIRFTVNSIEGWSILAKNIIMYLIKLEPTRIKLVHYVFYCAFETVKFFVASLATPDNFCAFALDGVAMGSSFGLLLSVIATVDALWRHTMKFFDNEKQFSKR